MNLTSKKLGVSRFHIVSYWYSTTADWTYKLFSQDKLFERLDNSRSDIQQDDQSLLLVTIVFTTVKLHSKAQYLKCHFTEPVNSESR